MLEIIDAALAEDVGDGDLTTAVVVEPGAARGPASNRRPQGCRPGCGSRRRCSSASTRDLRWHAHADEGVWAEAASGGARGGRGSILAAERVALNFLGRLSGVATLTARYVGAVEGTGAQILDTRKTTPGLRALEKEAVRAAAGSAIAAASTTRSSSRRTTRRWPGESRSPRGSPWRRARATACRSRSSAPRSTRWRTRSPRACRGCCSTTWRRTLRPAVELAGGRAELEASGGITLDNVRAVAETGVDYISVGALTHSAPALDSAFCWIRSSRRPQHRERVGHLEPRAPRSGRALLAGPPSRPGGRRSPVASSTPAALQHPAQVGRVHRVAERGGVDAASARRSRTFGREREADVRVGEFCPAAARARPARSTVVEREARAGARPGARPCRPAAPGPGRAGPARDRPSRAATRPGGGRARSASRAARARTAPPRRPCGRGGRGSRPRACRPRPGSRRAATTRRERVPWRAPTAATQSVSPRTWSTTASVTCVGERRVFDCESETVVSFAGIGFRS